MVEGGIGDLLTLRRGRPGPAPERQPGLRFGAAKRELAALVFPEDSGSLRGFGLERQINQPVRDDPSVLFQRVEKRHTHSQVRLDVRDPRPGLKRLAVAQDTKLKDCVLLERIQEIDVTAVCADLGRLPLEPRAAQRLINFDISQRRGTEAQTAFPRNERRRPEVCLRSLRSS